MTYKAGDFFFKGKVATWHLRYEHTYTHFLTLENRLITKAEFKELKPERDAYITADGFTKRPYHRLIILL